MPELHAAVRIAAGADRRGQWRLPRRNATAIGRAPRSAIHLSSPWIPRTVAVLEPERFGWLLRNGHSTRVEVRGPGVRTARFEPGGVVALVPGDWELNWALDHSLRAEIAVSTASVPGDLPWALSRKVPVTAERYATAYVADRELFSPAERHLLAVLFAYEFEDVPPPRNICQAAAEVLNVTSSQVKNSANTVRRRINRKRHAEIETLEDLGFYLVHTAHALSDDDLDP